MPRMSIYLPDDLADQLKATEGNSASQTIQEALRSHLTRGDTPSWAVPPTNADELLTAAIRKLHDDAVGQYQDGYKAALARIPDLDWETLTDFARAGFDLVKWVSSWSTGVANWAAHGGKVDSPVLFKLAKDLGRLADPIGYDEFGFRRTDPFERGYGAGLRAAYEAVQQGLTPAETSTQIEQPGGAESTS